MAFECFRCGECCTHLGHVHVVREDFGNYHFLIFNNFTGEETPVTVDPDKREIFDEKSILKQHPHTCPFFRHQPGGELAYCTVHLTRPDICHDYQCWRILILNPRGRPVGKIRYIRTLISDDPFLNRIWEDCIEHLDEPDDRCWENEMIRILTRAGYAVRK
jgi:uncharacterized protein